jgi:hypothetical protein
VAGVQHLVLLGYALKRIRSRENPPSIEEDFDGSYLELLSDALHPSSNLKSVDAVEKMFWQPWDELEKSLPGCGARLQDYLKIGVDYVMESITYIPILPIMAEEKGLKTRFPTCSLTAVNLVQQVLRRVIDHVMIRDPRFTEALGGTSGIDLRGESGPWDSQDCTAATDFHAEWLTGGFYHELANRYPQLEPYRKWFHKLFGPKKLLTEKDLQPSFYVPTELTKRYPRAPLLDDRFLSEDEEGFGKSHPDIILRYWNDWINFLNKRDGTLTTTGQMMGDPTSFPILMHVSLCSAEETIKMYPYTPQERKRRYAGLRRADVKMKGIGDDAVLPRWHRLRHLLYYSKIEELGGVLSLPKCYWHPTRGLIAEVPLQSGHEIAFWPTSILVAPPGGSKGQVTWVSQPTAFGGDPTRPTRRIPKMFWKLSPYYYTWKLARRLGLPISAPEAYGGIGLPIFPKVSTEYHTLWLSYLSQRPIEELIIGLGLSPIGHSGKSLLDKSAADWVKKVLADSANWASQGLELLTKQSMTDAAEFRVSLKEGYRMSVSRIRSVEFYFRTPPECIDLSAPSVRMSSDRFRRKVSRQTFVVSTNGYGATKADLERKTEFFFSVSGGYLPDPWAKPSSCYGLERSTEVKLRWKAPWLRGIG